MRDIAGIQLRVAAIASDSAQDAGGTRLHVAYCAPALPEAELSNGIVTYTRIMRDALRGLGHAVTVVTPEHIEFANGDVAAVPHATGILARARSRWEAL